MAIKTKLRERCGEIALLGGVLLLVAMLLLAVSLEVGHVYAAVDRVKDCTNTAVLAVAAGNVDRVHDGVREGTGTARHFTGTVWSRLVSTEEVMEHLAVSLDMTRQGHDTLVRVGGFRLTGLRVVPENQDNGKLNFTTTMTVEIPLSMGGGVLPPIQQTVEVHTTYEPKF